MCRKDTEDPKPRTGVLYLPIQVFADKFDEVQPVRSDREIFNATSGFISATDLFESAYQERSRETQREKYGKDIDHILDSSSYLPEKETRRAHLIEEF